MHRDGLQPSEHSRRAIWLLSVLLFGCLNAPAERLPLKTYTTADGLPHNVINKIVRDSRGFLWFCTEEGLSRFDGYTFINYGTSEGLPHASVNDLLETRAGEYWLATNGGLVHFNPKGAPTNRIVYVNEAGGTAPMFSTVVPEDSDRHARAVTALLEGHDGTLWCGTHKGLYRLDSGGGRFSLLLVEIGMPAEYGEWRLVVDLVEDRYRSIWVATHGGLYRRWADGSAARYAVQEGLPDYVLHDLLIDHQGQLWVGTRNAGFFRIAYNETHATPSVTFNLSPRDFGQSEWINQLFETSDNKLWAATARGLLEFIPGGDAEGRLYRVYHLQNGLSDEGIITLGEDMGGNLWLGSGNGGGVMKLAHNGFVTYGGQDGIKRVGAVFPDRAGGVCFRGYVLGDKHASIFDGGKVDLLNQSQVTYYPRFGRFDGHSLTWFTPDALKGKYTGWVDEGVTLQARRSGEWWIANGLYHFPATDDFTQLKSARPLAYFGKDKLLTGRQIWRLFEDSQGRIWISVIDAGGNGLALWERETQTLRDLTDAANLPSFHDELARSFGEDRAGNIWIGFNTGVARFRNGTFTFLSSKDGLPPGGIVDIYTDHEGRLWLASARSGLVRVEDPAAEHLAFTNFTTEQGLSGNVTLALAEDRYGRIYVGTGQGLDQLNPATHRIKHYTTADGLAGGKIASLFSASDGSLWIGTSEGLSRFQPEPEQRSMAPPVLLMGLKVASAPQNISALGESEVRIPDLLAGASQMQIDFVGLGFASGESLRYQYLLEGADRDWSAPSTQRSVTYARLASGRYRFLVRAVNADGQVSATPAVIIFRVLPPVWLRWWFIALVAMAVTGLVYLLYRYRVARLLEVANMRTRIATDLHDDIGANLTKIAILSEVAKQQQSGGNGKEDSPLHSIARISRESVASMNDIVWAIDPQRDHLIDLVRRMRREAEELFAARDIELTFLAPGEEQDLRLGVDVRRDLFLIFKEAINNAARHSQCRQVKIEFSVEPRLLAMRITDDGVGFDLNAEGEGHGLQNLRQRAEALRGELTIYTRAEKGTIVDLKVPRAQSRRRFGEKSAAHPV